MAEIPKRVLAVLGALVALAAVGGAAAVLWLPNHRPELRPGERYGVDVPHHQGSIDWHRVEADGISFAYIKATEGSGFEDPRFRDTGSKSAWRDWIEVPTTSSASVRQGSGKLDTSCT